MADERKAGRADNIYSEVYRRSGHGGNEGYNVARSDASDDVRFPSGPAVNFPNARYQFVDWIDVAETAGGDFVVRDLSDEETLRSVCDGIRGYDIGALVIEGHEADEGMHCLNFMLEHGELWDLLMERFGDDESVRGLYDAVRGKDGGFETAASYFKSHPTALDDLMADEVYGRRFREAGLGSVAYDELLQERSDIETHIVGDDKGISAREYNAVLKAVDPNVAPRVAMSETEVPTWLFLAVDQSGDPSLRHSYGVTNMQGQADGRLGVPCGLFVARMRQDPSTGEMVPDIERVRTKSQIYVVPTGTEEGGADVYVVDPDLALSGDQATSGFGSDKKTSRIFGALCAHKDTYGDMLHAVDDEDEVVIVNPDDPSEVYRSVPAVRFCLGESSMRAMPVVDPGDLTGDKDGSRLRDYDPFNVRIRDLAKMSQGHFVDSAFDYRSDGSPESYLYDWMVFGDDDEDYGNSYVDVDDGYDESYDDGYALEEGVVDAGDGQVVPGPSPAGQGAYDNGVGQGGFGDPNQPYPPQQGGFDPYQQQVQQQGQFGQQQPVSQPVQSQVQQQQLQGGVPQGLQGQPIGVPQQPVNPSGVPPVVNGVGWGGPDAGMYGDDYDDYDDDDYDSYDDYDGYDDDGGMYAGPGGPGDTQSMPRAIPVDGMGPDTDAPDVVVSDTRPDEGDGYHYVSAVGPSSYAPELQDFEELLRAARSGEDVKAAMMLNMGHLSSKIETFSTKDLGVMRAVRESRIKASGDRRPVALTHAGSSFAHAFGDAFMSEQPGFVRRLAGRLSRAMQRAGRVRTDEGHDDAGPVRGDVEHGVSPDEPVVENEEAVEDDGFRAPESDGAATDVGENGSVEVAMPVTSEPFVPEPAEPVVGNAPEGAFYERYDPGYFYGDEISPDDFEEAYAEYEVMQGYVDDPGTYDGQPVSEVVPDIVKATAPVADPSVDFSSDMLSDMPLVFDDDDDGMAVYDDFCGYAGADIVEEDGGEGVYARIPPVFDGGREGAVNGPDDQCQP